MSKIHYKAIKNGILLRILFAYIISFSIQAHATSSMGTVLVTQVNGVPCFHVKGADEKGEKFKLHAVEIGESSQVINLQNNRVIWKIEAPWTPYAFIWPKAKCVKYSVLPHNFLEKKPPIKLIAGKIYHANIITTRDSEENTSSLFHRANFCISTLINGTSKVHPILWDKSAQRWRTEVCDSVAPSK
jgi:hypothetical protein